MPDAFPKLRDDIDAAPASRDGEVFYIIYDRAGVAPGRLLASPLALLVASRLDGRSSILEIADALAAETAGGGVSCSDVAKIVTAFSEALFLDDNLYHDYHEQADRDFRAVVVRPPGSAGSAYSEDAEELARDLDRMLDEAPPPEEPPPALDGHPPGVIAPHIDYLRGGHGYGQLYGYLRSRPAPRAVVVLGTAHLPLRERYSLCEKDFATPLGDVRVDREIAGELRRRLAGVCDVDRDILSHRGEHSVELQAVWIRHIYGERTTIVPLIANSLSDFIEDGGDPRTAGGDPAIKALAEFLGELVEDDEVMLLASADLSHVGPRFGDERDITNQFMAEVETADRDYLAAAAEDATLGLVNLAGHGDRYHVCGSASIFAMGTALPGRRGRLLGYHQAVTPEMGQAVTYASMVFA